jgi:hypothetical protein
MSDNVKSDAAAIASRTGKKADGRRAVRLYSRTGGGEASGTDEKVFAL